MSLNNTFKKKEISAKMMYIDQLKITKNDIKSVKLSTSPSRKFYLANSLIENYHL